MKDSGLSVCLVDKQRFPRDKVCGDAIGGRAGSILRSIDPSYADAWERFPGKNNTRGWQITSPGGKTARVLFAKPGHVSKRIDFDNFLLGLVRDSGTIQIRENITVKDLEPSDSGTGLVYNGGTMQTRVLIAADGAHSIAARKLAGYVPDPAHFSGAVRAYYEKIDGIEDPAIIEIHLMDKFLPGYFWIFPLSSSQANVGFGMLSSDIQKRKLDLKKVFQEILVSERMGKRFAQAVRISPLEGFGLPLGGRKMKISGSGFILTGDAASLVDPLNGEGIGNAMWSGKLAAEAAMKAFTETDFSAEMFRNYDLQIQQRLLPELRKKLFLQRLFNRPWLIDLLVGAGERSPVFRSWLGKKL